MAVIGPKDPRDLPLSGFERPPDDPVGEIVGEEQVRGGVSTQTRTIPKDVSIEELALAALEQDNIAYSTYAKSNFIFDKQEFDVDPDFNILEYIEGTDYQEFMPQLLGVRSEEEFHHRRSLIDRSRANEELLDGAFGHGLLMRLAAGVFDPFNLIPLGGGVARARQGIKAAAKTGVKAGALGGAIAEGIQSGTDPLRDDSSVLYGFGGGALLGGALGGAGGVLARGRRIAEAAKTASKVRGAGVDTAKARLSSLKGDLKNAETPDEIMQIVDEALGTEFAPPDDAGVDFSDIHSALSREAASMADDVASGLMTPDEFIRSLGTRTDFDVTKAIKNTADQIDVARQMSMAPTRKSFRPRVHQPAKAVAFAARPQSDQTFLVGFRTTTANDADPLVIQLDAPIRGDDALAEIHGSKVWINHKEIFDPDDLLEQSTKLSKYEHRALSKAFEAKDFGRLQDEGFRAVVQKVINEDGQATREVMFFDQDIPVFNSERKIKAYAAKSKTNREMRKLEDLFRVFCD